MGGLKNVLIIGCGAIGALYDTPKSEAVRTYAHAFSNVDWVARLGFVETNPERAKVVSEMWKGSCYASLEEAVSESIYDIGVISVPEEYHLEVFKKVCSQTNIKFVIMEKPIATSLDDARTMKQLAEYHGITIIVNYSRVFLPQIQLLRNMIKSHSLGCFLFGNGTYGKGLLHNGSHLLNLVELLLGEIVAFKPKYKLNDFVDPSIAGEIQLNPAGVIHLDCVAHNLYTIFELELTFELGKIKLLDSTRRLEIWRPEESSIYRGYSFLEKKEVLETDLDNALRYLVDHVKEVVDNNETPICSIDEGLRMVEVWHMIQMKL